MKKNKFKIMVACGGTGGHIFPALSFLEKLGSKQEGLEIIIVATKREIENQIIPKQYKVFHLSLLPLGYSHKQKPHRLPVRLNTKNLKAIIFLGLGAIQSFYIVLKFRPDIVVGFGGYATLSLLLCARMLGIKTIIHEQNAEPGISNKLLARYVDRIAISFIQTADCLGPYKEKIIYCGNPRSQAMHKIDKRAALGFFDLSPNRFTILVMGGSQGSAKINHTFIESLCLMQDRGDLQVIHLSGKDDFAAVSESYQRISLPFRLYHFLEPMHYAYSAADLVITRGGATTIGEIIFFELPAIIIPYPLAHRHQSANANLLIQKNAAILIEEHLLNPFILKDTIFDFLNNQDKLEQTRRQFKFFETQDHQQCLSEIVSSLLS